MHRARRPKPAPRMNWRRSRGIPAMAVNTFMSGVSAGTTGPVMKRSQRSRRWREWNEPPNGLLMKVR